MSRYFLSCLLIVGVLLIGSGCSGNTVAPDVSDPQEPGPVIQQENETGHGCLGFYLLEIDTENQQINPVKLRTGEMHLNLTSVLNSTMGLSVAGVPSEHDPPNGIFTFDITLSHPFATKPQFSGFDVKGILITPGSLVIGPNVLADTDETQLLNADGYTRWWNPTEFTNPGIFGYTQGIYANSSASALTATVNPYKYFADLLVAVSPMTSVLDEPLTSDFGRGIFKAGSDNTRRYTIRFPMSPGPQVTYGYAIDCSWSAPSPNPPIELPDDFPIDANQPEAVYVSIEPIVNTLHYDSESSVGGGVLRLQIDVHDWQGQLAGNIHGEISAVRVYSPDLMSVGVDGIFQAEGPTKARYVADLTGLVHPTQAGEVLVVVRVQSAAGPWYTQSLGYPAPESNVSAWQTIMLDVPDPTCSVDTNTDWSDAVTLVPGTPVGDQVCLPDDGEDFFTFEYLPDFEVDGDVTLYCSDGLVTLGLYDSSHVLITEKNVINGSASIALDANLLPGDSCIRVSTTNPDQVAPYLLDLDAQFTNVLPDNPI